jgi:hypothetical protein
MPRCDLCSYVANFKTVIVVVVVFVAPWPNCGPWPPRSQGFLITHDDGPQSVGLLWTSDQLVAETSTWQHITLTTDRHPCPPVGFEPTISAGEWPQTYVLDCVATGTGFKTVIRIPNSWSGLSHMLRCLCALWWPLFLWGTTEMHSVPMLPHQFNNFTALHNTSYFNILSPN